MQTMTPKDDALNAALNELEETAKKHVDRQRGRAGRWRKVNWGVGLPAAGLAGVGGVAGLADLTGSLQFGAAVLSIVGGGLAGAAATLNAGRQAEGFDTSAAQCDALERDIRIFRTIHLPTAERDVALQALDMFVSRWNQIQGAQGDLRRARDDECTPRGGSGDR